MTDENDYPVGEAPSDADIDLARAAVEQLLTSSALDDAALWIEPSQGLEEQLMSAVASDKEGAAPPEVTTAANVIGIAGRDRSKRRFWVPIGVAAAAVALIAVVTLRPAAPDWEIALGSTENVSGVTASVSGWNEPSGTRMALDIEGLDPAPPGFVYELWLSQGSIHISAGTFHDTNDVTLWAGVSRGDFPRLWITLESLDDGDAGPGLNLLDTEA